MIRLTAALSAIIIICLAPFVSAEEHRPAIVSERVQEIARDIGVAVELGIVWEDASPEDVGRYMGILAGASEVALVLARENGRFAPSDEDYQAALIALCFFPPNKPPLLSEFWPDVYPAFYSQEVRDILSQNVGGVAVEWPELLREHGIRAAQMLGYPQEQELYLEQVINLGNLRMAE